MREQEKNKIKIGVSRWCRGFFSLAHCLSLSLSEEKKKGRKLTDRFLKDESPETFLWLTDALTPSMLLDLSADIVCIGWAELAILSIRTNSQGRSQSSARSQDLRNDLFRVINRGVVISVLFWISLKKKKNQLYNRGNPRAQNVMLKDALVRLSFIFHPHRCAVSHWFSLSNYNGTYNMKDTTRFLHKKRKKEKLGLLGKKKK